ncbi:MAG TPA: hypothetical protein VGJ15_12185 [Pirellulales bacterium]|jgi:hypothetical protein
MTLGNRKTFRCAANSLALFVLTIAAVCPAIAAEPIGTPAPVAHFGDQTLSSEQPLPPGTSERRGTMFDQRENAVDEQGSSVQSGSVSPEVRFFPAVLETRRYGPVEEPAPQFYAMRNSDQPGFDWSQGLAGPSWYGYGGPYAYGFPGYGYGFGLVGYPYSNYRPWYAYPNQNVYSDRFPWYSPGGIGPNIYQPWYVQRNSLPWYSPYGIGPNIYTPSPQWQNYYPWYSPNGPGPNIYTPQAVEAGGFYW